MSRIGSLAPDSAGSTMLSLPRIADMPAFTSDGREVSTSDDRQRRAHLIIILYRAIREPRCFPGSSGDLFMYPMSAREAVQCWLLCFVRELHAVAALTFKSPYFRTVLGSIWGSVSQIGLIAAIFAAKRQRSHVSR